MKIALTTDSFIEGQGGVSTAVAALSRNLRERGHEVIVYAATDPTHEHNDLNVVGFRALRYERLPGGRVPLAPVSLVQELADFKPDVIHNHSMGAMGLQALAAAHLLGIPILGTCHVFLAGFLNYAPIDLDGIPLTEEIAWRYTIAFFNRFPHVTTPSEAMQRKLLLHGLKTHISAISNGVDTSLFSPGKPPDAGDSLSLLHVGRLGYEKRVDQVLRAFALVLPQFPEVRLDIVGDGPERESLETLSRELGIAQRVRFWGTLPRNRLPAVYRAADIFVIASTIETQGLVVLEAMSSGLPVVGVRALALPDLIRNGINGYLVLPDRPNEMAAARVRLLRAPDVRMAMGKEARDFVHTWHSLPKVAQAYENLYRQIKAKQPRSLLFRVPEKLDLAVAWSEFQEEGRALKEAGVERVWGITRLAREWGKKAFLPTVDYLRNEIPDRMNKPKGANHDPK